MQGTVADEWVQDAIERGNREVDTTFDSSALLQTQVALFEGCIVDYEDEDDSGNKCEELDAALTLFEIELALAGNSSSPAKRLAALFGSSKVDRAAARVRVAAAKFGEEQQEVAELWVQQARANGGTNPAALLEQQVALFGECLLDDDGGGSARCRELQSALGALQMGLGVGGKVMRTKGFKGPQKPVAAENADGSPPPNDSD